VIVDPDSGKMLAGCVIDFKDDFSGSGFSVSNPNAKKSCGCGKSFDA
jgi:iron-sulfur cluster assembly protein/iron-sulfur cluster insertion protein